jgi:hypothetical protein
MQQLRTCPSCYASAIVTATAHNSRQKRNAHMAGGHDTTTGITERAPAWKLRDVRWKHVFALQTWGLIVLIVVGGGVTYWGHNLYHVSGQWPAPCSSGITTTTSSKSPC